MGNNITSIKQACITLIKSDSKYFLQYYKKQIN